MITEERLQEEQHMVVSGTEGISGAPHGGSGQSASIAGQGIFVNDGVC
jgi:hypothetical protein